MVGGKTTLEGLLSVHKGWRGYRDRANGADSKVEAKRGLDKG